MSRVYQRNAPLRRGQEGILLLMFSSEAVAWTRQQVGTAALHFSLWWTACSLGQQEAHRAMWNTRRRAQVRPLSFQGATLPQLHICQAHPSTAPWSSSGLSRLCSRRCLGRRSCCFCCACCCCCWAGRRCALPRSASAAALPCRTPRRTSATARPTSCTSSQEAAALSWHHNVRSTGASRSAASSSRLAARAGARRVAGTAHWTMGSKLAHPWPSSTIPYSSARCVRHVRDGPQSAVPPRDWP